METLGQLETLVAVVVLIAMMFLATIDLAFSYLSDVGLRRILAIRFLALLAPPLVAPEQASLRILY